MTQPHSPSPQPPSPQDIDQILDNVRVAEATSNAVLNEIWHTRARLRRAEASLALVLGALGDFDQDGGDYLVHRISQELRRLAEAPCTAARLAGCAEEDVDPQLLQAIASHLAGLRSQQEWAPPAPAPLVMH